jgi:hypothetical protein
LRKQSLRIDSDVSKGARRAPIISPGAALSPGDVVLPPFPGLSRRST